jgi:hypothetical protein
LTLDEEPDHVNRVSIKIIVPGALSFFLIDREINQQEIDDYYKGQMIMIETLEQFLSAFRANPNSKVCVGMEDRDLYFEDPWQVRRLEISGKFVDTLLNLGIIYIYGGNLEVNPMAIRVLDRMQAEGTQLTEEAFHFEIEESKNLHQQEDFDDSYEVGNFSK